MTDGSYDCACFRNKDCDIGKHKDHCFSYAHIYNNIIVKVNAYHNGANCFYSDVATSKTTFENNIMHGGPGGQGGQALKHNCGLENLSKNNVVYRKIPDNGIQQNFIRGACQRKKVKNTLFQDFTNEKNIYLLENMANFTFNRHFDTYQNTTFRDNIYWSMASPKDRKLSLFPDFPLNSHGKSMNWYQWKKAPGNAINSIWRNPLFDEV
jgi:hypothetical protein